VILTTALCADAGAVLRRLRASGAEIARAEAMERAPAEPAGETAAAVRRWLAEVGDAADDLLLLAEARAGTPPWRAAVQGIRDRGEATSRAQLAVTGDDLHAAGIQPGPELGRLLGRLLDAVLEDPSLNRKDRLLELAARWR
jgi:tRNA nucleotidyltransferase (CCA-adding enzyme)